MADARDSARPWLRDLGHVMQMAARGVPPEDIFAVVIKAASSALGGRPTALVQFRDGSSSIRASHGMGTPATPADLDLGESLGAMTRSTGRPVRIDDVASFGDAGSGHAWGARAAVAVPVVVNGQTWGVITATSSAGPLPADTEEQLIDVAEIVAATAAGSQAWSVLHDLANEQAALRRLAELVVRGVSPEDLHAAVAAEASALVHENITLARLDGQRAYTIVAQYGGPAPVGTRIEVPPDDGGVVSQILRTGRPARLDDYGSRTGSPHARIYGVRAGVGVPITVGERIWGILAATTSDDRLADGLEGRLAQFAHLMAAAVTGVQARVDLERLADEQRALRTVAELAARGATPDEVFTAVATEASGLLGGLAISLVRFDGDRNLVVVASHRGPAPVGERIAFDADTLPDRVQRGDGASRVDDYSRERDAGLAARFGLTASAAAPVVVAGRVWGMLTATSGSQPTPPGTEQRLQEFAGLVAASMANVHARAEVQALADQQAALRRVAELAAREAPTTQILDAVAEESSWLAGVDFATVLRFEADGSTEIVALSGAPADLSVGMRAPNDGDSATARVRRTGRAARVDDLRSMSGHWPQLARSFGFSSSAAAPIRIDGLLWGVLKVVGRQEPLPPGIEEHLSNFSELTGTVIAAVRARQDLRRLAEEQTALRRVAEAVALGAPLDSVFTTIAEEASTLLGDVAAALIRYDGQDAVVVASCRSPAPVGLRVPADGDTATGRIRRTARPVRVDTFEGTSLSHTARELGVASAVAVPVIVEGQVWGTLSTSSSGPALATGIESRLEPFAQLAAVAIANAENKTKLLASRARLVVTADETRRRIQRDVHDSAQQRLVHTIVSLKLAKEAALTGSDAGELVEEALRNAERANSDLRDVVRGILPAALTRSGLAAGVESLLEDLTIPVHVRVTVPRLDPTLETTAYFVIAEALTNIVKHARAGRAEVEARVRDDRLVIEVRDDGVGGADPSRGTGLTGLLDRVEAAEGVLRLDSPMQGGTIVHVELPTNPLGTVPA